MKPYSRIVVAVLAIVLTTASVDARKKRSKAGRIVDSIYIDAVYNFKLTIPDNFKTKIHKDKTFYRLTLVQDSLVWDLKVIDRVQRRYDTVVVRPVIEVWVVSTLCSERQILDSLLSQETASDWVERLLMTLTEPYPKAQYRETNEGRFVRRKPGIPKATRWTGTFDYISMDLQGLKSKLDVSLVAVRLSKEAVLVMIMQAEREWLDATIAASDAMLASLVMEEDED